MRSFRVLVAEYCRVWLAVRAAAFRMAWRVEAIIVVVYWWISFVSRSYACYWHTILTMMIVRLCGVIFDWARWMDGGWRELWKCKRAIKETDILIYLHTFLFSSWTLLSHRDSIFPSHPHHLHWPLRWRTFDPHFFTHFILLRSLPFVVSPFSCAFFGEHFYVLCTQDLDFGPTRRRWWPKYGGDWIVLNEYNDNKGEDDTLLEY